jgi:hypothetical protein
MNKLLTKSKTQRTTIGDNMNAYDKPHEKELHQCYVLRDVLYVPSYRERKIFVAPSGRKYNQEKLIEAGAKERLERLWVRAYL